MLKPLRLILLLFVLPSPLAGQSAQADDENDKAVQLDQTAEAIAFFEAKIRPALIEHCLDCHSTETEASGGLLLDSQAGWSAGGDSGPSLIPGNAAESRFLRAISYTDPNLQMPPEGKLPEQTIAEFRAWIDQGAIDPRRPSPNSHAQRQTGLAVARAEEHWSYRSLSDPRPVSEARGTVSNSRDGSGSAVDYFIDRRLREAGIDENSIAGEANRETLVRRLFYDLTGLPPTPDEMGDALADTAADAYERLVDRLLASPRFGETFARRWMDVVRYADSITLRGFVLPEAWRYRDYLIDAYAEDRSFALMIREQIAGDQLTADDERQRSQQLVATAFWALGNTNLEQQDKTQLEMDAIDEQLDVMGSAFLGQTIGCARCHDHKFDPIPTQDYYALAGILRSSVAFEHDNVSKWIEQPLPLPREQQAEYEALASQQKSVAAHVARLKKQLSTIAGEDRRMIATRELAGFVVDSSQAKLVGRWVKSTSVGPIIGDSYIHDDNQAKGDKSATFEPGPLPPGEYQIRLAYSASSNRTSHLPVKVFSATGETTVIVNQQQPASEDGLWVSLGQFRFEDRGQAYVLISNAETNGHVIIDAVQFLPTGVESSQPPPAATSFDSDLRRSLTADLKQLEESQHVLDEQLSRRPRYMTIVEKNTPADIPIHIRGDVHNLGPLVARGFLTALKPSAPRLPSDSGGRLELANWISSPDNPLTARVYANRLWSWLMGQGLVASVNNFGTTGTAPSHPELLDWLAGHLIASDWSTKSLVREIVISAAYRRAQKEHTPATAESDPDNRLLWRGHSRRASVESLRDAMLQVSGELDLAVGGSLIAATTQADYNYSHRSTRRSIYHPVFRNSLPELFDAFDFANSSVSVGKRPRSTVAPQALVLMNHPWVAARAQRAAEHFSSGKFENSDELIRAIMLACFSRNPTAEEVAFCKQFLEDATCPEAPPSVESLSQLIQTLFASLDFRYLE